MRPTGSYAWWTSTLQPASALGGASSPPTIPLQRWLTEISWRVRLPLIVWPPTAANELPNAPGAR